MPPRVTARIERYLTAPKQLIYNQKFRAECIQSWFLQQTVRPEWRLPLLIVATRRVELVLDLGSTGRLGGSVPFAFFEPVALAIHLQDVNVMGEPIQ